jgi:hypothetical protein
MEKEEVSAKKVTTKKKKTLESKPSKKVIK